MSVLKNLRQKMCDKKMSFRNEYAALKIADKFGQRVYECPICFCWHCTSKDFQGDVFDYALRRAEQTVRTEMNKQIKSLNTKINHLLKENSDLRKSIISTSQTGEK